MGGRFRIIHKYIHYTKPSEDAKHATLLGLRHKAEYKQRELGPLYEF